MSEYVRPELLVAADWLAEQLEDSNVRIVDTRWTADPMQPSGREAYLRSHIPGAVYVDWATELAEPGDPVRGKLAVADRFANLMGRLGIDNDTTVVAYDDGTGPFSTRLWWALRYYGHERVHVLDGGFTDWLRQQRRVAAGQAFHGARVYQPNPRPELRVDRETVRSAIGRPDVAIIDVRPEAQFCGRESSGALRSGHIPGAVNIPVMANYQVDPPTFRPADELRALYQRCSLDSAQRVITTCNAGVGSAGALFALNLIGYDNVAVYDGSWSEWGNDPALPIER